MRLHQEGENTDCYPKDFSIHKPYLTLHSSWKDQYQPLISV